MHLQRAIGEFIVACHAKGLSPSTVTIYRYQLDRFQAYAVRQAWCDVGKIETTHLRRYFAYLHNESPHYPFGKPLARPLSPATIHQAYRTLKTFFNWLLDDETIAVNPMLKIDAPRLPKLLVPRLDLVNVGKLIRLIQSTELSRRNLAIIELMVDSGLRRGEVVRLELCKIDLAGRTVQVIGKGRKERKVPISIETRDALKRYLQVRPRSADRIAFLNKDGSPLTASAVYHLLKRLQVKLGLPKLYPHLLRHTFAKIFVETGDIGALKEIMGHASLESTLIYTSPDEKDMARCHAQASPLARLRKRKR